LVLRQAYKLVSLENFGYLWAILEHAGVGRQSHAIAQIIKAARQAISHFADLRGFVGFDQVVAFGQVSPQICDAV
jgi:hypothetical protein